MRRRPRLRHRRMTQLLAESLSGSDVVGIDASAAMLEKAAPRARPACASSSARSRTSPAASTSSSPTPRCSGAAITRRSSRDSTRAAAGRPIRAQFPAQQRPASQAAIAAVAAQEPFRTALGAGLSRGPVGARGLREAIRRSRRDRHCRAGTRLPAPTRSADAVADWQSDMRLLAYREPRAPATRTVRGRRRRAGRDRRAARCPTASRQRRRRLRVGGGRRVPARRCRSRRDLRIASRNPRGQHGPRLSPAPQRGAERLLRSDRGDGCVRSGPLLRRELCDELAARPQQRVESREERRVIAAPLQRGVGEDEVEPAGEVLDQALLEAQARPRSRRRLLEHRRRRVDADDVGAGEGLRQQLGQFAGAAAEVDGACAGPTRTRANRSSNGANRSFEKRR